MAITDPNELIDPEAFFQTPSCPQHRQYEALRAYFVDGVPSPEVAETFGYTPASFRMLCYQFRHDAAARSFFVQTERGRPPGVRRQDPVRETVIALRKRNYSVQDISTELKEQGTILSAAVAREILREEGFAPLPRRLDEERPAHQGPAPQAAADVREFDLSPGEFDTQCGGLFLFLADLVRLDVPGLARRAGLPGSTPIPSSHALLSTLALKLWSIERKSHVMSLAADPGIALFAGLNVIPKKSYLSEYSHRVEHRRTLRLLGGWHDAVTDEALFDSTSFNLDFHSIPYFGEHPTVQKHYVSMRSRRQPAILTFVAQDATSNVFCYANADLRKGDEPDEIFRFISFWKNHHGALPGELIFDSKLTTYTALARLDKMKIPFITLRRRTQKLTTQLRQLPPSAWRVIPLEHVARKFRTPRVHEDKVTLGGVVLRQLAVEDLGHDEPTILLTNQWTATPKKLVTRYAQRMLIENALSDAVRFFHMNALSSSVALKVDFDLALLVIASGLYRMLAARMRGYDDAQARQIFRDLVNMPASIKVTPEQVTVAFHRRAHLPIVMASGLLAKKVSVPWWRGARLRFHTDPR